ncbi:MAG: PfkB family carbohydrate kinase [Endomicrobia bacterium]|nr:PfkB family carbohydrate kinase [Endomicrobiia bacterium]MDW8055277.1 PfkB family carbohydrate kinase [Elusimicrobiota bacterium]
MSLLIIGSIAFDSIKTPFGRVKKAIGGSAVYASIAASYFVKPIVVGVVGKNFKREYIKMLQKHNIDTSYIQVTEGKTFFWQGYYEYDLNVAHTVKTEVNVFARFNPTLSPELKNIKFVFLGNINPELQYNVYTQINNPVLVACDTIDCWIENKRKELKKILKVVDILFINESEIRKLAEEYNILKAAKYVKKLGTKIVVVKRGEYGAICFYGDKIFSTPAYPLENVYDPTGAGDSFAGGVMGYLTLSLSNGKKFSEKLLRQAVIYGTATASFCVEDFSINKIYNISYSDIIRRYNEIKRLITF